MIMTTSHGGIYMFSVIFLLWSSYPLVADPFSLQVMCGLVSLALVLLGVLNHSLLPQTVVVSPHFHSIPSSFLTPPFSSHFFYTWSQSIRSLITLIRFLFYPIGFFQTRYLSTLPFFFSHTRPSATHPPAHTLQRYLDQLWPLRVVVETLFKEYFSVNFRIHPILT